MSGWQGAGGSKRCTSSGQISDSKRRRLLGDESREEEGWQVIDATVIKETRWLRQKGVVVTGTLLEHDVFEMLSDFLSSSKGLAKLILSYYCCSKVYVVGGREVKMMNLGHPKEGWKDISSRIGNKHFYSTGTVHNEKLYACLGATNDIISLDLQNVEKGWTFVAKIDAKFDEHEDDLTLITDNGKLYSVAKCGDHMWIRSLPLNDTRGGWTELPKWPRNHVILTSVAIWGRKLCIVGLRPHSSRRDWEKLSVDTISLDHPELGWNRIRDFSVQNFGFISFAATIWEDKLVVVGGELDNDFRLYSVCPTIIELTARSEEDQVFRKLCSLRQPLTSCAIAVHEEKLFVAGAWESPPTTECFSNEHNYILASTSLNSLCARNAVFLNANI
mmetsp:Transcript_40933/g.79705  ORF Transcript_40933/g.79705 Transcript_40933/m.79705 type:complete len:388 (+) Transcript_40933:66-1229(+)